MEKDIRFGTDGWRGVISDTFTFSSLRQVTQAIADAVASEEWLDGHGQAPSFCRLASSIATMTTSF